MYSEGKAAKIDEVCRNATRYRLGRTYTVSGVYRSTEEYAALGPENDEFSVLSQGSSFGCAAILEFRNDNELAQFIRWRSRLPGCMHRGSASGSCRLSVSGTIESVETRWNLPFVTTGGYGHLNSAFAKIKVYEYTVAD